MSGGDEDRLFALMEIAQGHQAAVQVALDGLEVERAALQRERETLARQVKDLQLAVQATVRATVRDSLADAATEGTAAVKEATRPLLDRVAKLTAEAGKAEVALRRVVSWASRRSLGWVMAAAAGLLVLGWLASTATLWWDNRTIAAAQAQKAALQAELAQMQANQDTWEKAGMLGKLEKCGPKARPCVRVDETAGTFGDRADYRVILGY